MTTETVSTSHDAYDKPGAWCVAVVATAVLAVVLGVFGSIGVLIDPLAAEFGAPRQHVVLMFAAALAVHSAAARTAGRAMDRWGPRPLLTVAAAAMAGGLLAPAAAPVVWVAIAGYGVGLGLASACTWVATTAAVSAMFERRRAAALGLLTAGPALGGTVLAPVMTAQAQASGPRFTCALLAVLGATVCTAGALWLRVRHDPERPADRGGVAGGAGRIALAGLLMGLVVFLPLVHMVGHATYLGLSPGDGAAVLVVISAASAAARVGAGWLATPRTLPGLYLLSHLLVSGGFLLWAITGPVAPLPMLLAVAVLFGAGYGAWLALGPALLAAIRHPAHLGRALGSLAAAVGTGGVLGPVLAAPLFESAATTLLGVCSLLALGAAAVLFAQDSRLTPR